MSDDVFSSNVNVTSIDKFRNNEISFCRRIIFSVALRIFFTGAGLLNVLVEFLQHSSVPNTLSTPKAAAQ